MPLPRVSRPKGSCGTELRQDFEYGLIHPGHFSLMTGVFVRRTGSRERGVGSNALQRIGNVPFVIVLIIDALEIGCVIRIASAFVSRYFRIGAERASPFDTLRR